MHRIQQGRFAKRRFECIRIFNTDHRGRYRRRSGDIAADLHNQLGCAATRDCVSPGLA
jgi:hypothetical protein